MKRKLITRINLLAITKATKYPITPHHQIRCGTVSSPLVAFLKDKLILLKISFMPGIIFCNSFLPTAFQNRNYEIPASILPARKQPSFVARRNELLCSR